MPYKNPKSPAAIASRRRKDKKYRLAHPEKVRAFNRATGARFYRKHKSRLESARLKYQSGVTLDELVGMVKLQNGLCALCFRPLPPEKNRDWCLDHNHKNGKNRGVIHRKCNVAIGQLEDDPRLLRLAAEYLEKHDVRKS